MFHILLCIYVCFMYMQFRKLSMFDDSLSPGSHFQSPWSSSLFSARCRPCVLKTKNCKMLQELSLPFMFYKRPLKYSNPDNALLNDGCHNRCGSSRTPVSSWSFRIQQSIILHQSWVLNDRPPSRPFKNQPVRYNPVTCEHGSEIRPEIRISGMFFSSSYVFKLSF